jgi:hypothetical protein
MKASLVAYDFRELQKKSELIIVKFGYVRASSTGPPTGSITSKNEWGPKI